MSKVFLLLSRISLVFISLLVLVSLFTPVTSASSTWFGGQSPTLTKDKKISIDDFNEIHETKNGITAGLECIEKRIARRVLVGVSVQFVDDCWYETEVGLMNTTGEYILQPDTELAAHVGTTSPSQPRYFPTVNKKVFLEMTPDGVASGYRLAFRKIENMRFTRENHTTGTATLTILGSPDYIPVNRLGSTIFTSNHDVWWSNDGKYMLHYGERGTIIKFDLDNFNATSIEVFRMSGISRGSVAISPSGQYVAFTIERTNMYDLVLIDTSECGLSAEAAVKPPETPCNMVFYEDFLKEKINDFNLVRLPRFFGESTLGFYHYTGSEYELYYLQAPGTDFERTDYLALGDSFSSGEGAFDYIDGTDVHNGDGRNLCHTSRNSYPYLINQRVDLTSFLSVACSGAMVEHYNESQIPNAPEELIGLYPGTNPQNNTIDDYTVFTISMSGNDIGFTERLKYCLLSNGACYSSYEDRIETANQIQAQHPRLVEMYDDILNNSVGGKLYVLGYPQIMSNQFTAECGLNVGFNTYQRIMAHNLINYFNHVIKSAAENAGAYYVDVEEAFAGHKLCEDVSATMAVNGLTKGDDVFWDNVGPIGNESYHPNQLGHQLLAGEVIEQTNYLTRSMPDKQNKDIPGAEFSGFLGQEPVNRPIRDLYYVNLAQPTLKQRGEKLLLSIPAPVSLDIFDEFEAFLHSSPVSLGKVYTNGAGNFDTEVTIPSDTEPGMHELHLIGEDINGSPVDIYQYVYVAASLDDFDGDGALDIDEPCGIINPSGQDQDQDGIDDACDPTITSAPSTPKPTTSDIVEDLEPVLSLSNNQDDDTGDQNPYGDISNLSGVLNLKDAITEIPANNSVLTNDVKTAATTSSYWWLFGTVLTVAAVLSYSVYRYAVQEKE